MHFCTDWVKIFGEKLYTQGSRQLITPPELMSKMLGFWSVLSLFKGMSLSKPSFLWLIQSPLALGVISLKGTDSKFSKLASKLSLASLFK